MRRRWKGLWVAAAAATKPRGGNLNGPGVATFDAVVDGRE
jgi:hypothetical protein